MCFTKLVTIEKDSLPEVAKRDIIVYKVIGKDGYGWMRDLKIAGQRCKWKQGWHYIEETPFLGKKNKKTSNREIIEIRGNAFHSCKTRGLAILRRDSYEKVVKMIIPKGAKYYENADEYVSSEIIYP